jgi:hypothetical protein
VLGAQAELPAAAVARLTEIIATAENPDATVSAAEMLGAQAELPAAAVEILVSFAAAYQPAAPRAGPPAAIPGFMNTAVPLSPSAATMSAARACGSDPASMQVKPCQLTYVRCARRRVRRGWQSAGRAECR